MLTYRVSVDPVLVKIRALKVMEVREDVLVLILVVLSLQLEDGRDELRETQQLCYDGIASAHQLQDGLATVVVRREKILRHGEPCGVRERERERCVDSLETKKTLAAKDSTLGKRLEKRRWRGPSYQGGGALD